MRENHIFPFLWMRGEEPEIIRTEMNKIHEAGMGAVCLEARPHPDFAGEGWWHDVDIVIEEAKKLDMQVWFLDDAHFPTGMANNGMNKHPEKARRWLYTQFVDVTGPMPMAQVDVDLLLTKQFTWVDLGKPVNTPLYEETKLLSVTACKMYDGDVTEGEPVDLTDKVADGWLTADIPEGTWRIYVTFSTTAIGPKPEYINYIEADSVRVLIDEVYEKHYARYKDLFGTTIAGFFSDEPGFYTRETYDEFNYLGVYMVLPWGREMEELMKSQYGENLYRDLPLLYNSEKSGLERTIRATYMDSVTTLYSRNFCDQLGDWCRDHGVRYIGHIVEDNNGHMRLGAGVGHYFRSMTGQDMAGIDNIGYQLMPGNDRANRHTGYQDLKPEFFHYELGKLGSSCAAIDPLKKGRTMCENFGAYGWRLGVRDMKWLVDYFLTQGTNYFVPHAFSMGEYPDPDCPPHFYARGENPQFPSFCKLMKYTDRLCNLFSEGEIVTSAALLYEAESDWSGNVMSGSAIGKELIQHQIDYTIIPADVFTNREYFGCKVENGVLVINGHPLKALIIPECEYLPAPAAAFIGENPDFPVYYINSLPIGITGKASDEKELLDKALRGRACVPLESLSDTLIRAGIRDELYPRTTDADLHQFHYRKEGRDAWMFMNASLSHAVDVHLHLPEGKKYGIYDAMKDVTRELITAEDFHLVLSPYESLVILTDPENALPAEPVLTPYGTIPLEEFSLTLKGIGSSETALISHFHPVPVSSLDRDFSGEMIYNTTVNLEEVPARALLTAQYVYECMTVTVNGSEAGFALAPPYEVDITPALKPGVNEIRISVVSTALRHANTKPGPFGKERTVLEPTGMFGKIEISLFR